MKAFVLAAGFGSRLRPLTDHIPKPLMPILNVPSLFYTFFLLKEAGIDNIICNIHHHADAIRRMVASADLGGLKISFSEEKTLLGTGGGLKNCENLLRDDDFLLVNSDIITDIDFRKLVRCHAAGGCPGTLTLYESPDAMDIGVVSVENGLIRDFRNRRNTGIASSCIYTGTAVLSPLIFRFLEKTFSGIVETGFTGLMDHGGLGYYLHKGLWQDIGTPESYMQANTGGNALFDNLVLRMNRVSGIHPHRISDNASIGEGARITSSVIGEGCSVGENAVVEYAVLLPGARVAAGATVRHAVLGRHGTLLLNQ